MPTWATNKECRQLAAILRTYSNDHTWEVEYDEQRGEYIATNQSGEPRLIPNRTYAWCLRDWLGVLSQWKGLV